MSSDINSSSNSESKDPYLLLGISPGDDFETIQKARDKKLLELGDDSKAKAKIEASYDALLMSSLKERQLGKVSNEAFSASKREEKRSLPVSNNALGTSLLTKIRSFGTKENTNSKSIEFSIPKGQNLAIRISFGLMAIVLLLVSPPQSTDLILSISTIALFLSLVRGGRRFLNSLGWSVVLLSIGLIIGQFIISQAPTISHSIIPLTKDQFEALPAVFLLWLGIILLD